MNSCTLIVDGNWFLISRAMVRIKEFDSSLPEEMIDEACDRLYSGMVQSLMGILSKFTMVDNMILVSDDKSWRKSLIKPGFIEWSYKGNRDVNNDYCWDKIFGTLNRLIDKCDDVGITTCKIKGAEGDDTIMYSTKWLNSKGVNTIIWSTDADLQQLLSAGNACTVIYNGKSIVAHKDLTPKEDFDATDFLMSAFTATPTQDLLRQFENLNFEMTYVNPEDITMQKIICGDTSDNIKSIITTESNGRTYSVSPKMLNEIKSKHHINNLGEFFDNRDIIIAELFKYKRFKDENYSFDNIRDVFEYNKKIVWLDLNNIPKDIYENLKDMPSQYVVVKNIRELVSSLETTSNDVIDILEDLPF